MDERLYIEVSKVTPSALRDNSSSGDSESQRDAFEEEVGELLEKIYGVSSPYSVDLITDSGIHRLLNDARMNAETEQSNRRIEYFASLDLDHLDYLDEMTEAAQSEIQDFYTSLRLQAVEENKPTPVSEKKVESLVRLAEVSARLRLSSYIEKDDAQRAIDIVQYSIQDLGFGQDDDTQKKADEVKTGRANVVGADGEFQKQMKQLIEAIADENDMGAPVEDIIEGAETELGIDTENAEHVLDMLREKGEVFEPRTDHLRTT